MNTLLYDELVPFYHLLDPLEDHREEALEFGSVLKGAVADADSILELGAGAGHGAYYVKQMFGEVTLSDVSAAMLARSMSLNKDCTHVHGDMRDIKLGRTFDCAIIHDAIAYIVSQADLLATATTVFEHLRPGGAALLIPDCVKESFKESHEIHAGDDDERSLRCIYWSHDPDPTDDTHIGDFAFLLREQGAVRAVHDRHVFGLFSILTWVQICEQAGFKVETISRPLPAEYENTSYTDKMFLCRKS